MHMANHKDRSATDTILGYFYQFDRSILEILKLPSDNDSVVVEGIEDIDVRTATGETAVQCKYYEKTEYNHSIIAKPIRFMLSHYKQLMDSHCAPINYCVYGRYHSGQDKLVLPIDVGFLKKHFLTYVRKGVSRAHHVELGLSDTALKDFLVHLKVDVNARPYHSQLEDVASLLKTHFTCSDFEARHFYYNNALVTIKDLAIRQAVKSRTITKKAFITEINKKEPLFNLWYIQLKGREQYFKEIKKAYFTLPLNTSPNERFFLMEIPASRYALADLKTIMLCIQKKWSKLSQREGQSYCPYIYVHGLPSDALVTIKTALRDEGCCCVDGYDFLGATFCSKSILRQPTFGNGIKLKIISEIDCLKSVIIGTSKTTEVYQFHIGKPFFKMEDSHVRHIQIQVEDLRDIQGAII